VKVCETVYNGLQVCFGRGSVFRMANHDIPHGPAALAYKGMNKTELASQLGWTKQILAARMDTGKFTLEEWAAISQAIGAKIDFVLKFEDGHKVIITE